MKRFICTVIALVAFCFGACCLAAPDVRVLGGVDWRTDVRNYVRQNNFRVWLADHRYSTLHDMYTSQDESVILDTWNGRLGQVFLLKPGYKTDKGIAVGMTMDAVEDRYGTKDRDTDRGDGNYAGYRIVEYISESNEGLAFVYDKNGTIVLIRYQANRHGNTHVMMDVKEYNLLPYAK